MIAGAEPAAAFARDSKVFVAAGMKCFEVVAASEAAVERTAAEYIAVALVRSATSAGFESCSLGLVEPVMARPGSEMGSKN